MQNRNEYFLYNSAAINTLKEIDAYTNYKFNNLIEERIHYYEFERLIAYGKITQVKNNTLYKKYFINLGRREKVKFYLRSYFPSLYQICKKLISGII